MSSVVSGTRSDRPLSGCGRLTLDEMVAVDRRGDGRLDHAARHELEEGHLCGRVLHGHSVRLQPASVGPQTRNGGR